MTGQKEEKKEKEKEEKDEKKEEKKKENCRGRERTDGIEGSIKDPRGPKENTYHLSYLFIIIIFQYFG